MKAILTISALFVALATPAMADTCWQNNDGAKLVFSSTDAGAGKLVTKGASEDCTSARDDKGSDIACGAGKPEHWFRIAAKPGYVTKDILVWRDEPWFACK
jgi:hypothetical protein